MILNLGFLALCLFTGQLSVADPLINARERKNENYDVSSSILKMISRIPFNGTMGWKLLSTLEKYPRNLDVTFVVGHEKWIVKAPRLILISSSPVFEREFERHFEQAMVEECEEIPLPDLDPQAFKLFVELIILDNWSVEALKALELPSNQLLHLMSICHKYEMKNALMSLTELAKNFLKNFGTFVKPEEFLQLTQLQLEAILASDELPMKEIDVYTYACSWAKEQCKKKGIDVTGESMRQVLGGALYQIRFPVMSFAEFATVIRQKGLLSMDEVIEIVEFLAIGEDEDHNESSDSTKLKFKVEKRRTMSITSNNTTTTTTTTTTPAPTTTTPTTRERSVASVTQVFPVVQNPFVCDGIEKGGQQFNTDMKITLFGVGFLGPIDADSFYDVTVDVLKFNPSWGKVSEKMRKRIFAQKAKTFYFEFDTPIVLYPIRFDNWRNYYYLWFSLTGPNTQSLQYENRITKRIYDGNKEFVISWGAPQLVEILYTTF